MIVAPRLLLAAPSSGSGKSVIASGIMAALSASCTVQGFKTGPDYIDPMYHTIATGRPSRNLDTWMLTPDQIRQSFSRASADAAISIIEGVMGLFDGVGSDPFANSTAELAELLECPIVLVIDCSKMSASAAAIVHGMNSFSHRIRLSGVICNRVGSENHARSLREAIEQHAHVPVLGCIPKMEALRIPERHLGLFTVTENPAEAKAFIDRAADCLPAYIDFERLWEIAKSAAKLRPLKEQTIDFPEPDIRLAVARDEAFCFYYEDNLEELRQNGAEIIFFSPLQDEILPKNISGIYIGGGYPEIFAGKLSDNRLLRNHLHAAARQGIPLYAECGGLMYLTKGIRLENDVFPLVGLLPGLCEIGKHLRMGYREVEPIRKNILSSPGMKLRGHEFHYSIWNAPQHSFAAYQVKPRPATAAF